jgi:putative ABC transport system permease protein
VGMTLSLALRNLLRNRRRSLATLLALAIGAAAILLFGGYTANIRYSMVTGYVRMDGHLQIQHRDFFASGSGHPTAYGITQYQRLIDAVGRDDVLGKMVLVATPKLQFGGIAGNYAEGVSRTVLGSGYVVDDYTRMQLWNEYGVRQPPIRFHLEGTPEESAVVGTGVARALLLCGPLDVAGCSQSRAEAPPAGGAGLPADVAALADGEGAAPVARAGHARVDLLASDGRGTPNVAALDVVAATNLGLKEWDDVALILHLRQAQKLVYGRSEPRATSIMLQLHRTDHLPTAIARVQQLLKQTAPQQPLAVLDFQTLNPFYVQTQQLFDTIFGFIFTLISAIVLFTVANTMTAAVVERTVEVGTVRAIGLRRGGVRQLFVAEGALLGVAGAALGVLAALVIAAVFNSLELTWLPPGAQDPAALDLRVWGEWPMIVGTALGLLAVTVASAWWPARRAARLNIVEALRHT